MLRTLQPSNPETTANAWSTDCILFIHGCLIATVQTCQKLFHILTAPPSCSRPLKEWLEQESPSANPCKSFVQVFNCFCSVCCAIISHTIPSIHIDTYVLHVRSHCLVESWRTSRRTKTKPVLEHNFPGTRFRFPTTNKASHPRIQMKLGWSIYPLHICGAVASERWKQHDVLVYKTFLENKRALEKEKRQRKKPRLTDD